MFDRLKTLIQHLKEAQDVDALTDRDLLELGVSRDQLADFLRMPTDVGDRVTAMGAIFGVSEADLKRDHAQWIDLLCVCGHCVDRGACAKVLARGTTADPAGIDFCANREALRARVKDTA